MAKTLIWLRGCQADLGHCCHQMPKDMYLHGVAIWDRLFCKAIRYCNLLFSAHLSTNVWLFCKAIRYCNLLFSAHLSTNVWLFCKAIRYCNLLFQLTWAQMSDVCRAASTIWFKWQPLVHPWANFNQTSQDCWLGARGRRGYLHIHDCKKDEFCENAPFKSVGFYYNFI